MRPIIFKGLADSGVWACGRMVEDAYGRIAIVDPWSGEKHEVDPETVGQYTGLMARNGKPIYEGDIVRYCGEDFEDTFNKVGIVKWDPDEAAFYTEFPEYNASFGSFRGIDFEVIGNMHYGTDWISRLED